MFRCVRLWTDREGNSQFEEGFIDLPKGERGDMLSSVFRPTRSLSAKPPLAARSNGIRLQSGNWS